jgi:hypothetical protein
MKPRQLLGAVALVLGTLAALAGPASAGEPIDPTTLARGPAPHAAYLAGLSLHTATGRVVHVPLSAKHRGSVELLGHTARGWVVVDHYGSPERVLAVRGGHATTLLRWDNAEPMDTVWALSRDRTRLLQDVDGQGAYTDLYVHDLSGKRVGHLYVDDVGSVLDFSGPAVVFGGTHTWLWTVGRAPVKIWRLSAASASFAHDVLFADVRRLTGRNGPTPLDAPAAPAWSAGPRPVAVSPDGTRVLATRGRHQGYEVRDLSTGAVLGIWNLPRVRAGLVRWEDDRSILVGVRTDSGEAVVRCSLGGTCERATPWTPAPATYGVPLTSPDRYSPWGYY